MPKFKFKSLRFLVLNFSFVFLILHFAFSSFAQMAKEEEDLSIAQKAYDGGFYEISLGLLERFIKDYPGSGLVPQANLIIGQCLFQKGKYLKAKEIFERLLNFKSSEPIKDAVLHWIAEVYFKSKDYLQARIYYQKLVQRFPGSSYAAFAQYSIGWSFFEEGKFSQAKDAFLAFKHKFPQDKLREDADFKIALCFYNVRDYSKAKESLSAYIKSYPLAKTLNEALFYRAECLYYLGEFLQAEKDYLKVSTGGNDSSLVELAQAGLGWVYIKLKRYPEAEKFFNKIEAAHNKAYASVLLGMAEIAKQGRDHKSALGFYNKFIEGFPNDDSVYAAYFQKAESLSALFKDEEAIAVYNDILAQNLNKSDTLSSSDKVRYAIASLYLKMGNFSQAIREFQKAYEESNDTTIKVNALCQIGDIYQDLGEFKQALDSYQNIVTAYPANSYNDYVQYRLNFCLLKMARFDEAISGFRKITVDFPETKFKDEIDYCIATAYFQKHDFNNAVEALDKFISLFTQSPLRPDSLYLKAVSLSSLGRYKEAQEVFKQAKKEYGQDLNFVAKCEFEIARALYQNKEEDTAIKKCQEIISRYPNSNIMPEVIYFLGEYYLAIAKEEVAIRYFRRLVSDYPESNLKSNAYYSLGSVYLGQDKYDEALNQFANIIELPKSELKAQAALAIGDVYAKKGDFDAALKQYQEVETSAHDFSKDALLKAADIYKRMNKYDEAISAYEQALRKSSQGEAASIQFKIAQAFEESARTDQAIEEYRKNIYLYSADKYWVVKTYLRLGRIFEDQGNWAEARNIYAALSGMDAEEAKFAQERLEIINKNAKMSLGVK